MRIYAANKAKTKPLLELPGADTRLSLWEADLLQDGSFDDVISGSIAVFHVATPMDFDSTDPKVIIYTIITYISTVSITL